MDSVVHVAGSRLPFAREGRMLTLPEGRHAVRHNLTLPAGYGLSLRAGTVLEMGPSVSMVIYGPLQVAGTKDRPVRIVPAKSGETWGSVGVIRAGATSRVSHLEIEGGSETHINGVYLSGQLSFHWSDVELEDCSVAGARADDGLNIKKATFSIRRCLFQNNSADAFDGDWVRGTIESSVFVDNEGDGVDLSGATVTIRDCVMEGMGDKALSVGEKSEVLAFNNVIRDSVIGVASKDLSNTKLYSSVFLDNETAVALYRKKQVFGGASGMAVGCLFWGNRQNVMLDEFSRFETRSTGVDSWRDHDNVTVTDLLRGDPGQHYRRDTRGNILHKGSDSAFIIQGETGEVVADDLAIPELAGTPAGLARPLSLDENLVEHLRVRDGS